MELASFVFMLYLGVRFLSVRAIERPSCVEERIRGKLNPHPLLALAWFGSWEIPVFSCSGLILAANFISRDWVEPNWTGNLSCVAGVAAGTNLWFCGFSYGVSRGHGKFTERTLLRWSTARECASWGLAVAHGFHIVWQMADINCRLFHRRVWVEGGRCFDLAVERVVVCGREDLMKRITVNPRQCGGRPCVEDCEFVSAMSWTFLPLDSTPRGFCLKCPTWKPTTSRACLMFASRA